MNSYFFDLNVLPENKLISDMKKYAQKKKVPIIQDEGLLMLLFVIKISKPKKILEIGTAIGYSSIIMALLDPLIEIDTIERDENMYNEAVKNVKKAKMSDRIHLHFGDALNISMDTFISNYDLIFIDAGKAQYINFFNIYEKYLPKGGIIFTDNLLFHGLVNQSDKIESKNLRNLVKKIENYNNWLASRKDYDTTFFSLGDGVAVSVKKNEDL